MTAHAATNSTFAQSPTPAKRLNTWEYTVTAANPAIRTTVIFRRTVPVPPPGALPAAAPPLSKGSNTAKPIRNAVTKIYPQLNSTVNIKSYFLFLNSSQPTPTTACISASIIIATRPLKSTFLFQFSSFSALVQSPHRYSTSAGR